MITSNLKESPSGVLTTRSLYPGGKWQQAGATMTMSSTIDYQDKENGFVLSSSNVQATLFNFGDGDHDDRYITMNKVLNVTIINSPSTTTPIMGDTEIVLTLTTNTTTTTTTTSEDDNNNKIVTAVVRFILITANQDWRQNQTYVWKLDHAWMGIIMNSNSNSNNNNINNNINEGGGDDKDNYDNIDWLHWNVESNNVDSVIQIPNNNGGGDDDDISHTNRIFAVPSMQFHFSPDKNSNSNNNNKCELILKDVQLGAHLIKEITDDGKRKNMFTYHTPCNKFGGSCSVVDGVTIRQQQSLSLSEYDDNRNNIPYYEVLLLLLGILCLWFVYFKCYDRRRQRQSSRFLGYYEQVLFTTTTTKAEEDDEVKKLNVL